ncbi:cytochrome P450 [Hypoxylon cercidicola]|nr:cytochrome P450 [Hypoxylon cercidicola]
MSCVLVSLYISRIELRDCSQVPLREFFPLRSAANMLLPIDYIRSLSLAGVFTGFAALLVTWYIVSAIATWYRLRHIPGPSLASFSYIWLSKSIIFNTLAKDFRNLNNYGGLARVGPNSIVTNDPDVLRRLASARTKYTKDEWYSAIAVSPHQVTMVTLLDNAPHDKTKAKTSSGYNGRENPDIEVAVDSQIINLINTIRRKHLTTKTKFCNVDLVNIIRRFTLDILTRLGYGQAFGFQDADEELYDYATHLERALKTMSLSQEVPFLRRIVFSKFLFDIFGPKATDEKGVGKIMGIAEKIIDERFECEKPANDMMASFIRHGLTRKECCDEAMLQLLAGTDTTAGAIRSTLLYIMATPRVYSRLKSMIKQCVERKEVSSPITNDEAQKLPYLQAVILEGLRIKNPLTYGHYKRVPPEGDTINGMFLPGGTLIGHNTIGLTHNEAIFGEDVDVFRPERFLECDKEKRVEMERAIEIIFGGGRWSCAGKSIAFWEFNKVYFELLRAFDFQLINPQKAWDESVYFLHFHRNMWVRITEAEL